MTRPTKVIVVSFSAILLATLSSQGYGVVANAILAVIFIAFPVALFSIDRKTEKYRRIGGETMKIYVFLATLGLALLGMALWMRLTVLDAHEVVAPVLFSVFGVFCFALIVADVILERGSK